MQLRFIVAAVACASVGGACTTSTQYQPAHHDRAHLVVVNSQFAISKIGSTTALGPMSQVVKCDEAARRYAIEAEQLMKDAMSLHAAAYLIDGLIGPTGVGIILHVYAATKSDASNASTIDAINRHNDAATCQLTDEKAVASNIPGGR